MSSKNKFLNDLEKGKQGEKQVAQFLQTELKASSLNSQDDGKHYDFSLAFEDGRSETFEVKTDFASAKTGNIFFEYSCNNKDSGLSATKANKWAVLIPHEQSIYCFCPQVMFDYLKESKHRNLKGGDRKAVAGYIVPLKVVGELEFVDVSSLT